MTKGRWNARRLERLPLFVFFLVAGSTALVFLASGFAMSGGFERAWEVLLGIHTPFGQASGLGVALSALGYIAVPTVIGLVIADGITRFTERRLLTADETAERIAARVDKNVREITRDEVAAIDAAKGRKASRPAKSGGP